MLLYVENKAFQLRTFVVLCSASETIARIRAHLLHSLYEIGHSHHQFRLQYKGTYLRDAYTLEEYKILNNAVIQMIPLDDYEEWRKDRKFYQASPKERNANADDVVQKALKKEIVHLNKREKSLQNFKIFLMMQVLVAFLALFTVYWYFCLIYIAVLLVAYFLIPSFTRIGGWVGKTSVRKKEFMIGFGVLASLMVCAGIALFVLTVIDLASSSYPTSKCLNKYSSCFTNAQDAIEEHSCSSSQKQCYQTFVWTAIYFAIEIVVMLTTTIICWLLTKDFKFNVGDVIEKYLKKSREMEQILQTARNGNRSEKRNAAFELATLASSGDKNRYEIKNNDGLGILLTLCLSDDTATQEYATEAIAECLTIKNLQDEFVAIGGLKAFPALLHVKNQRTLLETITALKYIVSDSDENKIPVVEDFGLDDLYVASKSANSQGRKLLAEIYLELAYYDPTRNFMVSRSVTVDGILAATSRSKDEDTILILLQAMELFSIESPQFIRYHEKLMKYLIHLPSKVLDKRIHYLVTKLLIIYAENHDTCEKLAYESQVIECLLHLLHTSDGNLQKSLAMFSLHLTEIVTTRKTLSENGLEQLLTHIQNTSSDRETWNLADQALTNLQQDAHESKEKYGKSNLTQASVTSMASYGSANSTYRRLHENQPSTSKVY